MNKAMALLLALGTLALGGCTLLHCFPYCSSHTQSSSSLVDFLYPDGHLPASSDARPQLRIPLRVGLAFLPSMDAHQAGLDEAHQQQLLERIKQRFSGRRFVTEIVLLPDYYLTGHRGFEGLEGVQRLYGVDVIALVSFDQQTHVDPNDWSLAYLTIVGAYVIKGSRHDVSTLVDLAVVDPQTRQLIIRAGGTDVRHGNTRIIDLDRQIREANITGFSAATDQMIEHFDTALSKFETDVRSGTAPIGVVSKTAGGTTGGGGAMGAGLLALLMVVTARRTAANPRPAHKDSTVARTDLFRFRVLRFALRTVLRPLFRVQISGDRSVFANARTLIVANHESFLDGALLGGFLPVNATFVVHSQVKSKWYFRWLLNLVPHLAVDSTSPLAMKLICRLVESGTPVVIFPEGRLTITGSLMKVYDGAAFVAAKTGATVVPVRIEGAGRSYFGRLAGIYPRRLLPKIRIMIQPPRTIPMPPLASAKLRRRRAGELMRHILLDMLVTTRPRRTLYGAFLDAKATFGSRYRLVEDVRLQEESYGTLLRMALGLGRLLSNDTQTGEMVGVMTPNAAVTLGLVLGLSATGRVPAMLNYTAGGEGLRAACSVACIRTIVTSRAFLERARLTQLVAALPGIRVLYLEDLRARLRFADKLWILWHRLFPAALGSQQQPDDPAVVLFTSGSEGLPKGVVHSHNSLLSNVAQIRAIADFNPLDKFMVALPVFHAFGLACGIVMPLVSGCKAFLYPSPLHYRIIPEVVYDRNCTVLFGTSTFLGNYGKFAHPYDFGRLRYVVAGAEKLSDEVRRLWIEKFGIRVLEGYGVTECAPVIAVNVPMACRIGSVGQVVPGMQYELEPVPGIIDAGVMHVSGPNLMKGYLLHDRPGVIQPPASIRSGWYSTGDIVSVDEDDFVHIRGRVKRFAKIAGEMISLEVVERIATAASPGFVHAASTRGDAAKGEAIVLFTTDPNLSREQLSSAAKGAGSPDLAVPRLVQWLAQIPLLGSGKTDYVRLKSLAENTAASRE